MCLLKSFLRERWAEFSFSLTHRAGLAYFSSASQPRGLTCHLSLSGCSSSVCVLLDSLVTSQVKLPLPSTQAPLLGLLFFPAELLADKLFIKSEVTEILLHNFEIGDA